MTGRAAGFCAGYGVPGYANPGFGRAFGRGRGFWGRGGGRGWRHWFHATGLTGWQRAAMGYPVAPYPAPFAPDMSAEEELSVLKSQADSFQDALEEIRKRIEELQGKGKQD